jgi:hypothetical protein
MGAVWVRVRSELRRRWRVTLVLALLVGLAGGVTIAGVAGARRTASAMDRFIAYSRPQEVYIVDPEGAADLDAIAHLPQVADAGEAAYVVLAPSTPSGAPDPAAVGSINPLVRISENGLGATSDIPYLVEGRLPDPGQPLEVAVNEEVAQRHLLGPGEPFRMWAYTPEQITDSLVGTTVPAGRPFDFTVTGIIRFPFDLDPVVRDPEVVYTGRGFALLGPAFWDSFGDEVAAFGGNGDELAVRLHDGTDVDVFLAAVRALPGAGSLEIQLGSEATKVQREAEQATGVEAAALVAFATIAAVAGLLIVGQALSRQVQLEATEHPTLLALGLTRSQLVLAALVRTGAVALPGAVLACALAVALSPLAPIGLARRAEIDPGIAFDGPVLVAGAVAVAGALLARAALAGWRRTTAAGRWEARHRSRVVEGLATAGVPHPPLAGVAMALDRGGRAGPGLVRTALLGALAGVALTSAALTFGASLDRLVAEPELQGWAWDVVVGNLNAEEDLRVEGSRRLAASPYVEGFSAVSESLEPLTIDGLDVAVAGVELMVGGVFPPLAEGRPPTGPGEVVLGGRTMQRLGLHVGDRIEASLGGTPTSLHVVGTAVLNPALQFSFTLDEGAVVAFPELRRLRPDAPATHFLVDYADGVDRDEAFAALQAEWGKTVLRSRPPVEVENLRRVAGLPLVLAGLVAALAVATLAHTLVTSVRSRRGELAVLKTLGFRRRDVAIAVTAQATTMVVIALVLGLPLGVAAGRWAWRLVADGVGAPAAVTPVLGVLAVALSTLALANLVACFPALLAARLRPAVALRSE